MYKISTFTRNVQKLWYNIKVKNKNGPRMDHHTQILDKILESKSKTNLLNFFMSSNERSFYIGELGKTVGGRNLHFDLNYFVRQGIVSSFIHKGRRYYHKNRKSSVYEQARSRKIKFSKRYGDELLKFLKGISGLKLAVLSGLFTGELRLPVDVLFVGALSRRVLEKFAFLSEKIAGQEINYAVLSADEFDYRKNVYDRFVKDIFENEHVVIVDKIGARKK